MKKTELIIGNFQFSLFTIPSLFFKKRNIIPKNIPIVIDIRKGLNNLKYPLLSIIVFSRKKIEIIGASFWLPGWINQTPDKNPNIIIAEINPKNFEENNLYVLKEIRKDRRKNKIQKINISLEF